MAEANQVDGEGWISDESSFYGTTHALPGDSHQLSLAAGDDATKEALEAQATSGMTGSYSTIHARMNELPAVEPSSGSKTATKSSEDVLQFLKSRPQLKNLAKATSTDLNPIENATIQAVDSAQPDDLQDESGLDAAHWKRSETIDQFLKRAPVSNPGSAIFGPWLWVGNPRLDSEKKHQVRNSDVSSFERQGRKLLEVFASQKQRKLRPSKDQLERDLLALAVKTGVTCSKWMFFPGSEDLDRYWRLVAEATADGSLGLSSKVATYSPDPARLICVYTYDFTDIADVRRVLDKLVDLGLCRRDGRPIYYKCDAYTYLDITSKNEYGLRASLYSSKEILENAVQVSKDGLISRTKKSSASAVRALES